MGQKSIKRLILAAGLLLTATACGEADKAITKQDGMTLIHTAEIENGIIGFNGPTPVVIYLRKNQVVRVEMSANQETPRYNEKVRKALSRAWDGQSLQDAATLEVDAVSGATYTSVAVIENVRLGLNYYLAKKKK